MFIVLMYLVSTLLAPAPLVSMVVDAQPHPDRLDVVVRLLNSDARYTDFAVTVADVTTPVHAPLSVLQTITTTLPLKLPPVCHAQVVYSLVVSARVLTDTVSFARTEVGGLLERPCPLRLYIP
jgi:hypothetical protein